MRLFYRSFVLGIIGFPFVMITRFLYEMSWGIVAGIVAALFIVIGTNFWPFLILAAFPLFWGHTAVLLGTLRPAMQLAQYPSEFQFELMMAQTFKLSLLRSGIYLCIFTILGAVFVGIFGFAAVVSIWADLDGLSDPQNSAFSMTLLGFGFFGVLLAEAIVAMPMAAGAFAAGTEGRSFDSLRGMGHRFLLVMVLFLVLEVAALLIFVALSWLIFSGFQTPELLRPFFEGYLSKTTGQPASDTLLSTPQTLGFGILYIAYYYLRSSFWAGTCASVFRDKMEGQENTAALPENPTSQYLASDTDIRGLRQQRMHKD